jgi:nucleotide-binding universal stress UspA family protein
MSDARRSDEDQEPIIQRILVALDASSHSLAALEAAAVLAAGLQAELVGIFVEDADLLRLAELPFARELGLYSAASRPLDSSQMERQLRARAHRAEQALAAVAGRAQVPWSFRVARGAIAAELLAAAGEADLISLGKVGWSLAGRRRVGSTAQAILSQFSRPVLFLHHGVRLGPPFVLVYDNSALARKALAIAARLVGGKGTDLLILVAADEPGEAQRLQIQAGGWLQGRGLVARFRELTLAAVPKLTQPLEAQGCGTLILPVELSLLRDEALLALLADLDFPVLLIR